VPSLFRNLLLLGLLASGAAASAQGGPPFRTDDPETPGNQHWEINFGFIGDRNPAAGAYQVPDFDINYGLGDRLQLKYELPIALQETRPPSGQPPTVLGGLGESLMGIKWRFYEHHPNDPWVSNRFGLGLGKAFGHTPPDAPENVPGSAASAGGEPLVDVSFSTYPQLTVDNPTRSVPRGVVNPGPDFLLPLEFNARLGPLRFDGEVGYHFANRNLPQSWIRGLVVGHEFSDRTEAYAEIYDQQDANRIAGNGPKKREATLGAGGCQSLNRDKTMNLLLMGGRSFQTIAAGNSQPSWIAYVGLQVLFGPKEPVTPQVEQKLPLETRPRR
jgi:hypothetical protein